MEWAAKINEGRRLWVTPGKYLRLPMLQTLARFVNDQSPLEDAIEGNAFTKASSCPARSKQGEETLAMSLALKVEEEERS